MFLSLTVMAYFIGICNLFGGLSVKYLLYVQIYLRNSEYFKWKIYLREFYLSLAIVFNKLWKFKFISTKYEIFLKYHLIINEFGIIRYSCDNFSSVTEYDVDTYNFTHIVIEFFIGYSFRLLLYCVLFDFQWKILLLKERPKSAGQGLSVPKANDEKPKCVVVMCVANFIQLPNHLLSF